MDTIHACLLLSLLTSGLILKCLCDTASSSSAFPLPEINDNIEVALENVENALSNSTLHNADAIIVSQEIPTIPMEDVSVDTDSSTTVYITNMNLILSPLQLTSVRPNLRIMNLNVNSTFYSIEVTGNYRTTYVDSSNPSSSGSKSGRFVLTFHEVDARGVTGLHLEEERLLVHGVDMVYNPQSVVFTVSFRTQRGTTEVNEDRSDHVEGKLVKRIFNDVTYHTDNVIRDKINGLLKDVTLFQIIDNIELRETFRRFATYQKFSLNNFMDSILNNSREYLPEQLPLPNYQQIIGKKIGLLALGAEFNAEDGWFRDVRTVERVGDVIVNFVNGSTEATATLHIKNLVYWYNRYWLKLVIAGPRGIVSGKVDRNSISIRIRVKFLSGRCKATLEDLKVRELKGIDVNLTGLGLFNWVLSIIATSIVNISTTQIIQILEESLRDEIREILNILECGSSFSSN